jgi:hypothetical protein
MAKSEHRQLKGSPAANAIQPAKTANNAEAGVRKRKRLNSQGINEIRICENDRTGVVLTLEKSTSLGSLTRNVLDAQISVRPQV